MDDENVYIMDVYNFDIYPHDRYARRTYVADSCNDIGFLSILHIRLGKINSLGLAKGPR